MKTIIYGFGLMGKKIYQNVINNDSFDLVGVVSKDFDYEIKENMYTTLKDCQEVVDVIIDFSHPDNLNDVLEYAIKNKTKLVIATTNLSETQIKQIEEASNKIAIFQSYNTSLGMQLVTKILKEVSKEFYENNFDIEIIEKHHNKKIDAPSGTAKLLYEVIDEEVGGTHPVYDRSQVNTLREKEEIGIQSLRGGTIFGEHEVLFAGNDEIVTVKHTALSKEVFVLGAIQAAKMLEDKEKGLYTLKTLY